MPFIPCGVIGPCIDLLLSPIIPSSHHPIIPPTRIRSHIDRHICPWRIASPLALELSDLDPFRPLRPLATHRSPPGPSPPKLLRPMASYPNVPNGPSNVTCRTCTSEEDDHDHDRPLGPSPLPPPQTTLLPFLRTHSPRPFLSTPINNSPAFPIFSLLVPHTHFPWNRNNNAFASAITFL